MNVQKWKFASIVAVVVSLVAFAVVNPLAAADHQPADKIAVAASGVRWMSTATTGGSESEVVTLASSSMKTSSPTDLVLSFNAECSLATDISVSKNSESQSVAAVKVWIELDGNTIPVASDDVDEPGKVVFCERDFKMKFTTDSVYNFTIETFLKTRAAHSFDWITLNVGSGVHTIEVKAQVEKTVNGQGSATAGIGKRTLIVEPVKLANDIVI